MTARTKTTHGADSVDFLCIGAQKSGTTFVTSAFLAHPEIQLPMPKELFESKELYFFSPKGEYKSEEGFALSNAHRDIEWYKRQFVDDSRKKGEISTHYILDPASAERIKKAFPNTKVFAILRNPVNRAFSQYNMERHETAKEPRSLMRILEEEPDNEIFARGLYHKQLVPYMQHFSSDQLRVYLFEDIIKDSAAFFADLFEFIGVDNEVVPPGLNKRMNKSSKVKYAFVPRTARFVRRTLEKVGLGSAVRAMIRSGIAKRYLYFHNHYNRVATDFELTSDERAALQSYYADDIRRLEQTINRDLSRWRSEK